MYRIKALSPVLLFALALLIGACGGEGYDSGETATPEEEETTEESEETVAEAAMYEGTLVDTKCYGMNHANTGSDHTMPDGVTVPGCGGACAAMGIPVALLEGGQAEAMAYVLLAPPTGLAEHIAKEARVTGTATFNSGLLPTKVEVKNDAGEWIDVTPGAMM